MRTEVRFLLAVVLMIGVLIITNVMFPPIPPEEGTVAVPGDSAVPTQVQDTEGQAAPGQTPPAAELGEAEDPLQALFQDTLPEAPDPFVDVPGEATAEEVRVESPVYRYTFTPVGARLLSARLLDFPSFSFEGGVELIRPDGGGALGTRILAGQDTLDLRTLPFDVEPAGGLVLEEGGEPKTLRFTYQHPTYPFAFEVAYNFQPDAYVVEVEGQVRGVDAQLVFTDLGTGIPFNEQRVKDEERVAAYVLNHTQQGIRAQPLNRIDSNRVEEGPLFWTALKSKYFVVALLAGSGAEDEDAVLGGVVVEDVPGDFEVRVAATQTPVSDGRVRFRLFLGPQEFARLADLGEGMQNVNPYGWKFFQPIVRPFVGIIMAILGFLHENLHIGYGWVLILFGIVMRVVLFPLNHKAMKAQMRNMAAQPLMQEIQAKYKDNPEKLQKEMMKLYKEHGFNPLAGCLPMLLPWPVLIALFFVFQNTIELRGVPFLWLPDLSAPDPFYILPIFLGVSMFLLQWVSMRTMPQQNQQMKMMMYLMPIMMVVIFLNLASGLNLYYATANIATLPQQIWIAGERKKAQAKPPLKLSE
jgi:YidC/Oxa1 family membrane protein insertase